MHDSAGLDGSTDLRPIEEENGVDGRRYSTAVKSDHDLPIEDGFSDSFDWTISQSEEDERQPRLNSSGTVQGDYTGLARSSFESEGTRKRGAPIGSSTTSSSESSEVAAIPVPVYVTLWLWFLHCFSSAFAKIFSKGKEF